MTQTITELYDNVTGFLIAWYERDGDAVDEADLDEGVIDCLVGAVQEAWQSGPSRRYDILEGSSTYVQCDLSADELEEYVELFEAYLAY